MRNKVLPVKVMVETSFDGDHEHRLWGKVHDLPAVPQKKTTVEFEDEEGQLILTMIVETVAQRCPANAHPFVPYIRIRGHTYVLKGEFSPERMKELGWEERNWDPWGLDEED